MFDSESFKLDEGIGEVVNERFGMPRCSRSRESTAFMSGRLRENLPLDEKNRVRLGSLDLWTSSGSGCAVAAGSTGGSGRG